ncbi:DNA repair protein RecO [Candidatus Symbiobacter mobilis CR]|uniref:DNA repair protein RecO n=2 Tax=Candidatus Symbiobacter TaxID=1436289 RepID=U5NAY2_9BURK|nr:DNA repair protein RecO [Candidatus Symbiobacter mobilis CR]
MLHRHDWSESSLIVEAFTRHHGRIAVLAKGAKRPSSALRAVLLPLQPLLLGFGGKGEVRTLYGAQWQGVHTMPLGDALLSGLYLNELLLLLLAREDPHPALFDVYNQIVPILASNPGVAMEPALRVFELRLLREIGVLPRLDMQTPSSQALAPADAYQLHAELGLHPAPAHHRATLRGAQWLWLQQMLDGNIPWPDALSSCAALSSALKPQLRALLCHHGKVRTLRTRQLLIDLQSL